MKTRKANKPSVVFGRDPVQIDKNIPLPDHSKRDRKHGNSVYPWMEMEIGDSFLFRGSSKQGAYSQASYNSQRLIPKKFVIRHTEDGYRCWRIA